MTRRILFVVVLIIGMVGARILLDGPLGPSAARALSWIVAAVFGGAFAFAERRGLIPGLYEPNLRDPIRDGTESTGAGYYPIEKRALPGTSTCSDAPRKKTDVLMVIFFLFIGLVFLWVVGLIRAVTMTPTTEAWWLAARVQVFVAHQVA